MMARPLELIHVLLICCIAFSSGNACPEWTSPGTPEIVYLQLQMTSRDCAECFCIVGHTFVKASTRPVMVEVGRLFGSQYPCTSGAEKRRRKNNDHWTKAEIIELVDGVSKEGIGKWSKVKGKYFSASIRTPAHLKDKWRNLVKACNKGKNDSRKKVKAHKATELVVRRFKHRILAIEAKQSHGKKKK